MQVDAAASVLKAPHTTAQEIALGNLDAEIHDAQTRPNDPHVAKLVDNLLTRGQFLGRVSDLEAADEASQKAVEKSPNDPKAHLQRAAALGALHAFDLASKEIDRAEAAKAAARDVAQARVPVLLALGKCEAAFKLLAAEADSLPLDLALRGSVEQRRGHGAEFERLFSLARERYRDASPFAVAWMDFERARGLERQGDPTHAHDYYAEAVTVLPAYAHAAVHLAATETPDRALAILAAVEPTTDDPDVLAAKADALRRKSSPDAEAASAKAKARFEELLAKHPAAFADHGAGYFLGAGKDLARALSLAKQAATSSPNDESLDHWLSAAQALKSKDEVCAAVKRAESMECVLGATLRARVDEAKSGCP